MWQSPNDVVLISDPRVTALPVRECGEPLADVRGRLRVDARLADDEGAYAHLRSGLLDRLERAERSLPGGYHLLIVEGYRPIATQRRIFETYRQNFTPHSPKFPPTSHISRRVGTCPRSRSPPTPPAPPWT